MQEGYEVNWEEIYTVNVIFIRPGGSLHHGQLRLTVLGSWQENPPPAIRAALMQAGL